jgi:hypothetical protein
LYTFPRLPVSSRQIVLLSSHRHNSIRTITLHCALFTNLMSIDSHKTSAQQADRPSFTPIKSTFWSLHFRNLATNTHPYIQLYSSQLMLTSNCCS